MLDLPHNFPFADVTGKNPYAGVQIPLHGRDVGSNSRNCGLTFRDEAAVFTCSLPVRSIARVSRSANRHHGTSPANALRQLASEIRCFVDTSAAPVLRDLRIGTQGSGSVYLAIGAVRGGDHCRGVAFFDPQASSRTFAHSSRRRTVGQWQFPPGHLLLAGGLEHQIIVISRDRATSAYR